MDYCTAFEYRVNGEEWQTARLTQWYCDEYYWETDSQYSNISASFWGGGNSLDLTPPMFAREGSVYNSKGMSGNEYRPIKVMMDFNNPFVFGGVETDIETAQRDQSGIYAAMFYLKAFFVPFDGAFNIEITSASGSVYEGKFSASWGGVEIRNGQFRISHNVQNK